MAGGVNLIGYPPAPLSYGGHGRRDFNSHQPSHEATAWHGKKHEKILNYAKKRNEFRLFPRFTGQNQNIQLFERQI